MVKDYKAYKAKVVELDRVKASHKVSTALARWDSNHPVMRQEARLLALADY